MKAGSVKTLCRHWLSGHCQQGDSCVFLHGQDEDGSLRTPQNMLQISNAALQDPSYLVNMSARQAAFAQQQLTLNNLTSQTLVQQGRPGMAQPGLISQPFVQPPNPGLVQPGLMRFPFMAQQMAGVQSALVMNPESMSLVQQRQPTPLPGQIGLGGIYQTGEYGIDRGNLLTSDMGGLGFKRKRKSRFHDGNETLPSVGVPGLRGPSPFIPGVGLVGMTQNPALLKNVVESMGHQHAVLSQPSFGPVGIGQSPASINTGLNTMLSSSGILPYGSMSVGQGAVMSQPGLMNYSQMAALPSHGQHLEDDESVTSSHKKKSRFHDSNEPLLDGNFESRGNYMNPAMENKYKPEDPTEEDDFIEDFVDKIMSGAQPKIIQLEDKSKKKGISFKNVFVPVKQRKKSSEFASRANEYPADQDSSLSVAKNKTPANSWAASKNSYASRDDYSSGSIFDYDHGNKNVTSEYTRDFQSFARSDQFSKDSKGRIERSEFPFEYEDQPTEFGDANPSISSPMYRREHGQTHLGNSSQYGTNSFIPRSSFPGTAMYQSILGQQNPHVERIKPLRQESQWNQIVGNFELQERESYTNYGSTEGPEESNFPRSGTAETRRMPTPVSRHELPGVTSKVKSAKSDTELGVTSPRHIIYGKDMPNFIVRFMKNAGKYKGGVHLMTKSYKLPSNCIGLTPPKMNSDAWEILTKKAQTRDEMLQDVERWFASGIIPLVKQVDFFGKGSKIMQNVCRYTSDALNVMAFVCSNLSIKRRLLMRNALHKKYSILCRRRQPVSGLLFGDSLPNDLLAVKAGTFKLSEEEKNSQDQNNDDPESENFKPTFFACLALPEGEVDESVANIINMACVNDGDVSDLREKYKIPPNCKEIIPPMINPEIWSLVSRSGLELDYRLQDVHLSIAEAMVPLMLMLQSVYEQRYNESETLTLLTDALLLLGNSTYQLNKVRMDAMRRSLPEQVHGYCGFFWPGADHISLEKLKQAM